MYHTKEGFHINNLDIKGHFVCMVYVKKETHTEMRDFKDDFLKYLGGQAHIMCSDHKISLITSGTKERVCVKCKVKKECISCPNLSCHTCLCKSCMKAFSPDEKSFVPEREDEDGEDVMSGTYFCLQE